MTLWDASVEFVPKVVWNRLILPEPPRVISITEAVTEKNWRKTNNTNQARRMRRYIHRHGIDKKLERMIEKNLITREQIAC